MGAKLVPYLSKNAELVFFFVFSKEIEWLFAENS